MTQLPLKSNGALRVFAEFGKGVLTAVQHVVAIIGITSSRTIATTRSSNARFGRRISKFKERSSV
ncbi:hypothetical protein [Sulfitobacter brevis]|uniref:hypothetical protein n=1 Tax=Sulfitobacter brevis TaxID=74348 RepID=UPI000B8A3EC5|nr:hypothetical protein [Sulfitobacter brevis]